MVDARYCNLFAAEFVITIFLIWIFSHPLLSTLVATYHNISNQVKWVVAAHKYMRSQYKFYLEAVFILTNNLEDSVMGIEVRVTHINYMFLRKGVICVGNFDEVWFGDIFRSAS